MRSIIPAVPRPKPLDYYSKPRIIPPERRLPGELSTGCYVALMTALGLTLLFLGLAFLRLLR